MENLLLKDLVSSYWYHLALRANATNAVDYMNLTSILERIVTRVTDIEGQRV